MSDPSRCWAPRPFRPTVLKALVRDFRYVCAALGPQEGTLDWMVADAMNTDLMGTCLGQVGESHPNREVVMVLDGASPHRAKGLVVPDNNIQLVCLPPYSPELNPTEILWHELREKFCANRVFGTLDAVVDKES